MIQHPLMKWPDPALMAQTLSNIAGKSQQLVGDFLRRQVEEGVLDMAMSAHISKTFLAMNQQLMAAPAKVAAAQVDLWQSQLELWRRSGSAWWGQSATEPVAAPAPDDRRFRHDDWQDHFLFDFIKQSYLLTARWLQRLVAETEGLDVHTRRRLDFYTRQFADTMAPTNFVITNPEVLRATVESGGENLLQGLSHLLDDLERGKGRLRIRRTDMEAFTLGENVAATPGKVIYQNELMQLIQYDPATATVFSKPLLIMPPWINKFYIMDLRPGNSLFKWLVDQGFTVFVISWVNPDERLAEMRFEDYLLAGTLPALEAVAQAAGERQVNAVGYCLGGTMLAITTAYLAAQGDDRISACAFLTTLLDFAEPGDLMVFIDEEQLTALEKRMARKGYLDGAEMTATFNTLRANDLIWSFFINNYLLGKEPFPFDLLYWNSDSTRMPAAMHSFYLRNFYQHNRLREPGGITLAGVPIDLGKIRVPAYFVATLEDHIAPWRSVYTGSRLLSGPVRFALGGSGHIAGVINHPGDNKYGYWTATEQPVDPEAWRQAAERHEGSWWVDWLAWLSGRAGEQVPARSPGAGGLPVIEDAPGSYVKARA